MSLKRDVKEVIRDCITKLGLSRAHLRIRRATGQNVAHLARRTLSERFSAAYENRVWLNDRPSGSLSGLGSELVNTDTIRRELPALLARLGTRILLDVGCGDFLWLSAVDLECTYIGVDIVEEVIAANGRHASASRSFLRLDATTDALPCADTVLCREVLFHLSFADIWKIVANIQRSKAEFLIATNDTGHRYNADIVSGDFRQLNLHRSPFYFPQPDICVPDDRHSSGRNLSIWKVSEITRFAP